MFPLSRFPTAVILAATLLAGCHKNAAGPAAKSTAPVPVNVAKAVAKDMPLDLRAIGNVESIATVEVKAQVSGELIEVAFQEGQDVKRGDLLFTIQPKLYATQLAQAEANLARDRAAAANAQREAERGNELSAKGAVAKEQVEQLRSTAASAAAIVKADEALLEIARVQVSFTTIRSPIDGRTGALEVQRGNIIKDHADTPMTTIKQLAPIYVTFAVPESHLAAIRKGTAEGPLTVSALDPQSGSVLGTGVLTFIANSVDMTTGTITLKGTFPNEDRALWPGSFVDVLLRLETEAGVTVIPSSAVTVGQKGQQVFMVKQDGTAELRAVQVGRTVGQEVIIKHGISPGETVVTNGQLRLSPGAKVDPKPVSSPSADSPRETRADDAPTKTAAAKVNVGLVG